MENEIRTKINGIDLQDKLSILAKKVDALSMLFLTVNEPEGLSFNPSGREGMYFILQDLAEELRSSL